MSESKKIKNWAVYMIECTDNSLYTGISTHVEKRYEQHASQQGAKYFRGKSPKRLVYQEGGHDRSSATRREMAIKKLPRTEKISLIASEVNQINSDFP